ncbi:AMP phosphorylase [Candidatus Micrarchaeota archaeon]|nr:AMP phosphorylase [Candidatus Micrarchaeota archaeon]MBU1930645.1 AMP phosphorylase [Candidatus Micrarchaeota archaeon]
MKTETTRFAQTMSVKVFDIEANKFVSIIHEIDAQELGIMPLDYIEIYCPRTKKRITTVVDTTKTMVKQDEIGLFLDIKEALKVKEKEQVLVRASPQPQSVQFIRKKLWGHELSPREIKAIIDDITQNKLTEIETSAFISAVFIHGNSLKEIVATTKALAAGGQRIRIPDRTIVDKHSIGGINGRASMILVPIIAAGGLLIPKTASRAITSAAGTADCMEVLANVELSIKQIEKITKKVGGVIAWGGAVELAPADDKIIKVEHPLSLDPKSQVIASVLAKKYSVGAQYVVIDIPIGPETKIHSAQKARKMEKRFVLVGKKLGMKIKVVLTNGKQPACQVFGACLEAKNALEILEGKEFGYLGKKSCELAGCLFEMTGKTPKGKGFEHAKNILESGKALAKMKQIIKAQNGKIVDSTQIKPAKFKKIVRANRNGTIKELRVRKFAHTARRAGAPNDKKAGVVILVKNKEQVKKGVPLFEIYSSNQQKLELAFQYALQKKPALIG